MRLLGIDPGTGITGFGVVDVKDGKYKLVDAGVVRTKAHTPQKERLETIFENISEIIEEHKPQIMSIEKLFFTNNITTAMTVSEARGVVLLCAQQADMQLYEYTPLQIKQAITGYGKADKKQVQEMVRVVMKLKEVPKPDDCADAIAVAVTHAMHAGL